MALTSRDEIVSRQGNGCFIGMKVDEDVARGDVVKISATNNLQVEKCDGTGDVVFGVVQNVSHSSTLSSNATGQAEARIWVGGGFVFAKVAVGAHTVGQELTGGAAGDFEAATIGTHHVAGVVVDATAIDTDYVLVQLI